MLVLGRRKDEGLKIGDSIEIVIVDIRYKNVRLVIWTPENIPVHRKEIYEIIQHNGDSNRKPVSPPKPIDIEKIKNPLSISSIKKRSTCIISRQKENSFMIGDDIEIIIIDILDYSKVKLGIIATEEVTLLEDMEEMQP